MTATDDRRPVLAILVPVYNEEQVVPLFFGRMEPVLAQLQQAYRPHLVFLNNASNDGTLAAIESVRGRYADTYVLTLSRNVGYQRSLEFGLRHCHADLFVFIDVDCEDPPEMIVDFVARHRDGYDIVYGERVDRVEIASVKLMRKIFYRLLRAIADEDIVLDMAEFSLMTAEVRDAVVEDRSSFPFIRASIGRVGFRRLGIPYRRHPRIAGTTHYNFWGMTTFAVGGLLSASTLLLRVVTYALPLWIAIMGGLAWFAGHGDSAASAALHLLGFAYCGTALSFIAIYLARIYKNTLGRPNAFLDSSRSQLQPRHS
jgi:glycosyltransferase involved in cell wall biosynthesis